METIEFDVRSENVSGIIASISGSAARTSVLFHYQRAQEPAQYQEGTQACSIAPQPPHGQHVEIRMLS